MKKQIIRSKGIMLAEMLTSLFVFGTIMTTAVSFFILSEDYFFTCSAQVDTLAMSQQAVKRLAAELQETDASSIKFSVNHDAVVFISARNPATGKFQINNGIPNWQKWVCYYLAADPNGPYSTLIRKESSAIFGGLPSTTDQTAPSTWLTQFQGAAASQWTVASGIQTFDMEDKDCGVSNSPVYIQVISTAQYRGQLTSYNPGTTVNWGGACSKTNNWVQAQVINQ